MKYLFLIIFLSFPLYDFAQTTSEVKAHAANELRISEFQLDSLKRKILSDYESDEVFIENFKLAQSSWRNFLDAQLKMKYPSRDPGYYGSLHSMCIAQYKNTLVKNRIKTLVEWTEGVEEGDACSGSVIYEIPFDDYDEGVAIIQKTSLVILGNVQDAGSPHIACKKSCCINFFNNPDPNRKVVSLGLIDSENSKSYVFEASPDFPDQMKMLKQYSGKESEFPDGIFLTHAHIGHYTGLMYLGREATNADKVPVYAMPKMKGFLEKNGPWDQLVKLNNIDIQDLKDQTALNLSSKLSVLPMQVPHRDEYSETVAYKITGPNKSALFIPDIDKWSKWKTNIKDLIKEIDYAFLDATFYDGIEINNRDIAEIPHPFVVESMELFKDLTDKEKAKIHFIHFNHTNPLLDENSAASKEVLKKGFKIARLGDIFEL